MKNETPAKSPVRPLGDLAGVLGITRAGIYGAYHRGYIGGVITVGAALKIRQSAFEYHAERGYGPTVAPWGSPEAAELLAAAS